VLSRCRDGVQASGGHMALTESACVFKMIWKKTAGISEGREVWNMPGRRHSRKDRRNESMQIRLPGTVKTILNTLHHAGYEAYAVGGCVRDSLLHRVPDDWDITTSARPEQVKALFSHTVDTGIEHGTVTVLIGSKTHEVTTYRIDGKYEDCRHPENVTFTASLKEDLKRRDFTINAMAYNEEEGLIDLYGGLKDLEAGVIRCVGPAEERFSEDALRILRAVRFSAQLDFSIDRDTLAGVILLAPNLEKISAERICTELTKLIVSDHPEYLKVAYEAGITKVILPEFDAMMQTPQNNPHHRYNVGEHTLAAMRAIQNRRLLRFTMLLHDMGKPSCRTTDADGVDHFFGHGPKGAEIAEKVMRRLKMDNDTIRKAVKLIYYHDWWIRPEEAEVRKAVCVIGKELFPAWLKVQDADAMAQSEYQREEKLTRIIRVAQLYDKIIGEGQCVSLDGLAVSGKDLLDAGVPRGPEIGRNLQKALELVLKDQSKNRKDILLKELGVAGRN
jgi:tRNA nucleotidyltransferase (CCA-adding enzyme)